ncbi:MAG: hypothetical protein K1X79_07810 [Oligoflexia bacterium]|nr:hypothetical protein [Oligoflexia bacterium]
MINRSWLGIIAAAALTTALLGIHYGIWGSGTEILIRSLPAQLLYNSPLVIFYVACSALIHITQTEQIDHAARAGAIASLLAGISLHIFDLMAHPLTSASGTLGNLDLSGQQLSRIYNADYLSVSTLVALIITILIAATKKPATTIASIIIGALVLIFSTSAFVVSIGYSISCNSSSALFNTLRAIPTGILSILPGLAILLACHSAMPRYWKKMVITIPTVAILLLVEILATYYMGPDIHMCSGWDHIYIVGMNWMLCFACGLALSSYYLVAGLDKE